MCIKLDSTLPNVYDKMADHSRFAILALRAEYGGVCRVAKSIQKKFSFSYYPSLLDLHPFAF